jgi:type III pantothenate kinase
MIAVDLGNTRAKFAQFQGNAAFPEPDSVLALDSPDFEVIVDWLNGLEEPTAWYVARTGRFPWDELQGQLAELRPQDRFVELSYRDVPIPIDVEFPEKVGLDRLLSAYGAFCIKRAGGCASGTIMVVDAGTAITIDLIAESGSFLGGAILPGLNTSVKSLSPILPMIEVTQMTSASYPGKNTEQALSSGIYWGAVGAIRQFYQLVQSNTVSNTLPLFLTGGDAELLYEGLASTMTKEQVVLQPNLVLNAIAISASKFSC